MKMLNAMTINSLYILMLEVSQLKSKPLNYRSLYRIKPKLAKPIQRRESVFETINIDKTINSLKKHGFSLGINLRQEVVQEINDFAMKTPCYGNKNTNIGFY